MSRVERYGVLGTETGGVFFTESLIEGAVLLGDVVATSGRQNVPLTELTTTLAAAVRARGGNVLVSFSYEQKGTIFSFSSTRMTARGVAARV